MTLADACITVLALGSAYYLLGKAEIGTFLLFWLLMLIAIELLTLEAFILRLE